MNLDPEHVSRFGPYAKIYQPESYREPPAFASAPQGPRVAWPEPPPPPEADVTVRGAAHQEAANARRNAFMSAANDTTETSTPPTELVAEPEDAVAPHDMIDVTLRRETATFSIPVSEARLPGSLGAALAKAADRPDVTLTTSAPSAALPPPLPPTASTLHEADDADTAQENELSDDDLAFIGRIAPEAAE